MSETRYDAFISYSHKNLKWGAWLQRKLENYRLPKALRRGKDAGRLKIFRDQTDLAGSDLGTSLHRELESARYLIVICSPAAAASRWVNEEVRYFLSLGREDRILPFIVEGEPQSDRAELECYPEAIRSLERDLHGANVQEIGKNKAALKLISVLRDVRFNQLADRDRQRRTRVWTVSGISSFLLTASMTTLLWRNAEISRRNREMAYNNFVSVILNGHFREDVTASDAELIRISAEAGNSMAMKLLFDCYRYGWGVQEDPEEAFRWIRRCADSGDPDSMVNLAYCYLEGLGTEPNPAEAFRLNCQAAEAGYAPGMLDAGFQLEDGRGVEPNAEEAFRWYVRSAEAGSEGGMYNAARCCHLGIGTARDEAQAFLWTAKLAEKNNAWGMYNLGLMYENGIGTEKNPAQAYAWYRRAAVAGDPDAQYKTGWCTENGFGTGNPAEEWYAEAAANGSAEAAEALERLRNGTGENDP